MELKIELPFQQLLTLVKTLTPSQKARLKKELEEKSMNKGQDDHFIDLLLNGPVYNEKEIEVIEKNRKSIATWRTKK